MHRLFLVSGEVSQDCQGELARGFTFIGPFESEIREFFNLRMVSRRGSPFTVTRHIQPVDGPFPLITLLAPTRNPSIADGMS